MKIYDYEFLVVERISILFFIGGMEELKDGLECCEMVFVFDMVINIDVVVIYVRLV